MRETISSLASIVTAALATSLVATGCTQTMRLPSPEDETAIYSLVLDSLSTYWPECDTLRPSPLIVLVDRTFDTPAKVWDWQGAPQSLRIAYDSANHRVAPLRGFPKPRWRVAVIDSASLWELLPPPGTFTRGAPRFQARYPNACFTAFLSGIGLSTSGTWATMGIQTGNWLGGGGGWAVLLRKRGRLWEIRSMELQGT